MTEEKSREQKVQEVLSLLPGKNCGKCGFEGCEDLAGAIVNGEASPFECHVDPSAGHEISKVLGIEDAEDTKMQADSSEFRHGRKGHGKDHIHGHHGRRGGHLHKGKGTHHGRNHGHGKKH